MGNNFGLIDLNENELRDCNGGFVLLVLYFLVAKPKDAIELVEGVIEGYKRGTATP